MENGKSCVICGTRLTGLQRKFCSNACRQADKYERQMGRRCKYCHQPIEEPVATLGGYLQQCDREECIKQRR